MSDSAPAPSLSPKNGTVNDSASSPTAPAKETLTSDSPPPSLPPPSVENSSLDSPPPSPSPSSSSDGAIIPPSEPPPITPPQPPNQSPPPPETADPPPSPQADKDPSPLPSPPPQDPASSSPEPPTLSPPAPTEDYQPTPPPPAFPLPSTSKETPPPSTDVPDVPDTQNHPPQESSPHSQASPDRGTSNPSSPSDRNASKHNMNSRGEVKPLVPSLSTPTIKEPTEASTKPIANNSISPSSGNPTLIGGLAAVGVVVVCFVIFFVLWKKRKGNKNDLGSQYRPPPSSSTSTGVFSQGHANLVSSDSEMYYGSKPPLSPAGAGNMYGNYMSPGYQVGHAEPAGSKTSFAYQELMDITNGFAHGNLIGEGGFGSVYKGTLPDGRVVAIKHLKAGGGQGEREFKAEVEVISRVHHRHLVSLVGYCIHDQHRLLVFEFLPNKTLEHHLHGKGLPVLDWPKRLKIAIGSARGLSYLHEDCHPRIIHRDIKSANILLDEYFEAQVADFGLARNNTDAHTHVSTRVMGTFGYLAPEYATSGKLTDRSDVFSFGVVLLELITGRRPVVEDESLVEWARPLLIHALETSEYKELVDPRLENNFPENEVLRMIEVAAACVRHSAPKRPRMVQVLRSLDSDGDLPDLSSGVKYGQSMVYNTNQYSADIQNFRRMAFGTEDFSNSYGSSGSHDQW